MVSQLKIKKSTDEVFENIYSSINNIQDKTDNILEKVDKMQSNIEHIQKTMNENNHYEEIIRLLNQLKGDK